MTNGWIGAGAAGLVLSGLMWLALFLAYRLDRPDAAQVALLTVLLTSPPLLSYLGLMQLTREQPMWRRLAAVYAAALAWWAIQRWLIFPLVDAAGSLGESLANFILLPAFGVALWLGAAGLIYRRRLTRALALQKDAELRLLSAQVAPHMLFNMLNTVYAALLTDRDKAIDLFLAMSEALRHLIGGADRSWAPLSEEVDFIARYCDLERARNPAARVEVQADGDLDAPVPPLLLATLFENAVKHGRLANGGLDIAVRVAAGDEAIELEVANAVEGPAARGAERGGLGLANVRKRLALLYPGRAELTIEAGETRHLARILIRP